MKKDIDTIVNFTIDTFRLSGFVLSDDDIKRIRLCAADPFLVDDLIVHLIIKHSKKE